MILALICYVNVSSFRAFKRYHPQTRSRGLVGRAWAFPYAALVSSATHRFDLTLLSLKSFRCICDRCVAQNRCVTCTLNTLSACCMNDGHGEILVEIYVVMITPNLAFPV